MKRAVAIVALVAVLAGCAGRKPNFYCDGTTGVYYKLRAVSAVLNHPRCMP